MSWFGSGSEEDARRDNEPGNCGERQFCGLYRRKLGLLHPEHVLRGKMREGANGIAAPSEVRRKKWKNARSRFTSY